MHTRAVSATRLGPSNVIGAVVFGGVALASTIGIALSLSSSMPIWLAGQAILGFALVQWFVILHECGHRALFRTRALNVPAGHIAGFFALIPFEPWRRVHRAHHRWTGWQDLDPTTEALSRPARGRLACAIVNASWKYWIPLFSTVYRAGNYWNVPRVLRMVRDRRGRWAAAVNIVAAVAGYAVLAWWLGPATLARVGGLALLLSFALEDPLLISQHTHVPQQISRGAKVRPYAPLDQQQFTRSLRLPAWLSACLLHVDAHELHHMYPHVPGYRLRRIPVALENEVDWREWLRSAKRVPGVVLLYQNRDQSGLSV